MSKNQEFNHENWQNSFFVHSSGHKAGISFGADWDSKQGEMIDCFYFNLYDEKFDTKQQVCFNELEKAINEVNKIYAQEPAWRFEDKAVTKEKKSGGCDTCSAH